MRRNGLFAIAYAGIALASLLLRTAVPVFAIGGSVHDDQLFMRMAYRLGSGAWLGPYDQFTLIKGIGHPLFMLAAFAAGVPLKIAEQLLYLAASALAAWLVWHLTRRRWLPLVLFGCLAFNPVLWSSPLARVIREGSYIGFTFALAMLAALFLLSPRAIRPVWGRVGALVALGLLAALYWITREEGPWLAPTFGVLAIGAAVRIRREHRSGQGVRQGIGSWARTLGLVAVPFVVFAACLAAVAGLNERYYGVFMLTEFQSGSFPRAYGALSRIQHEQWTRHVPVSDDALQKAYSVSPAARELQPSFDGKLGGLWRRMACDLTRRDPCPGFLGGWFMWALREAVVAAGHYSSARDASAYYERLAAEINAACDAGRIACVAARSTMAPLFRWHYVGDAMAVVPDLGRILLTFDRGQVNIPPSIGHEFILGLFSDLVGPISREPVSSIVLWGTASERGSPARLSVRDRQGSPSRTELRFYREPYPPREGEAPTDFELTTDCVRPTCELVVGDGVNERVFPIAEVVAGPLAAADGLEVTVRQRFGRGRSSAYPVASEMRRALLLDLARWDARIYAVTMPTLSALAALGILIALGMSRRVPWPPGLMTLALACAVTVAARIRLLAYLEVTSIPSLNLLYLSPASPFLLTFVVLGIYLGVRPFVPLRSRAQ
jgi:hypothetical protein